AGLPWEALEMSPVTHLLCQKDPGRRAWASLVKFFPDPMELCTNLQQTVPLQRGTLYMSRGSLARRRRSKGGRGRGREKAGSTVSNCALGRDDSPWRTALEDFLGSGP
ncbi:mCG145961, isoform CRA_a, partial [Mus musculus]